MPTLNIENVGTLLLSDPRCRQLLPHHRECFDAWARGRALGVREQVVRAEHEILGQLSTGDLLLVEPVTGTQGADRPDTGLFVNYEFDAVAAAMVVTMIPRRGWNWFLSREGQRCYLGGWR